MRYPTCYLPNTEANSAHLSLIHIFAALIVARLTLHLKGESENGGTAFKASSLKIGIVSTIEKTEDGWDSIIALADHTGSCMSGPTFQMTIRDFDFGDSFPGVPNSVHHNVKALLEAYESARNSSHQALSYSQNNGVISSAPIFTAIQYSILCGGRNNCRVSATFDGDCVFDSRNGSPVFGSGCLALEAFLLDQRDNKAQEKSKTKSVDALIDFMQQLLLEKI